jgi:quercetin dioxygenase-like cupin family protein
MLLNSQYSSFFGLQFIATSQETEGKYFLAKTIVPDGDDGPPPHIHTREDESFYIEKGELTFVVNDKEIVVKTGDFINIQKGEKHTWYNNSGKSTHLFITFCPGGIEEMFRELDQNMVDINEIGKKYGTEFFNE